MNQDDINEAEWRNPANWRWPGPMGLYASRHDTRLIVPKFVPAMGITVNFGHRGCAWFLIAITLLPVVLTLAMHLLI
jgi:uncharacterized membrane protein